MLLMVPFCIFFYHHSALKSNEFHLPKEAATFLNKCWHEHHNFNCHIVVDQINYETCHKYSNGCDWTSPNPILSIKVVKKNSLTFTIDLFFIIQLGYENCKCSLLSLVLRNSEKSGDRINNVSILSFKKKVRRIKSKYYVCLKKKEIPHIKSKNDGRYQNIAGRWKKRFCHNLVEWL